MNLSIATLCLLILVAQSSRAGKVESTFDKKADFGSVRTYRWMAGYDAYNPDAHKWIREAIDDEMRKRGLTQDEAKADVSIAYYTVTQTVVDLEAFDRIDPAKRPPEPPTKALGRLVIIMREADTERRLWTASTHEYVDAEPAKLQDGIRTAVARLYGTYPRPKPKR